MQITDLAWAAGIIDGEGCIGLHRHGGPTKNWWSLILKVTMGHEPSIRRLHDLFGEGSVQNQRPSRGQQHYNVAWSWLCTTRQVERVLAQVRPYLVTKAAEADLALEYLRLPTMPGTQRIPTELAVERVRLFEALRDAKPSARFRRAG